VTAPAIKDVRVIRWVAIIAGFIGFLFSVLTPLLPVVQTTATLNWPQAGQLSNVTAPLITETPVAMTATVPCHRPVAWCSAPRQPTARTPR
jgi:arabinosyltransferase B